MPRGTSRSRLVDTAGRRMLALLGAIVLSLSVAAGALAVAPTGQITVTATGCDFSVRIDLDQATPVVGWKIKVFNLPNWKDGTTKFSGQGPSDADGIVDIGPFTLPEGHYNVVVDDEWPIDGSALVQDFTLSCPVVAPTATPTATPTVTPSATPTATPTGNELPVTGTPAPTATPGGGEEAATGTPHVGGVEALTPPPTDAVVAQTTSSHDGLGIVLIAIAAAIGGLLSLALAPRRAHARARTGRR